MSFIEFFSVSLSQFYDFIDNTLDNQSGLIWNGTIDKKLKVKF